MSISHEIRELIENSKKGLLKTEPTQSRENLAKIETLKSRQRDVVSIRLSPEEKTLIRSIGKKSVSSSIRLILNRYIQLSKTLQQQSRSVTERVKAVDTSVLAFSKKEISQVKLEDDIKALVTLIHVLNFTSETCKILLTDEQIKTIRFSLNYFGSHY